MERINLSLKMPQQKTPSGSFAHSRNASKSGSKSPVDRGMMHTAQQTGDAQSKLYPKGARVTDQVQIAIDVANKISKKTQSIQ